MDEKWRIKIKHDPHASILRTVSLWKATMGKDILGGAGEESNSEANLHRTVPDG